MTGVICVENFEFLCKNAEVGYGILHRGQTGEVTHCSHTPPAPTLQTTPAG